MDVRTTDHQVVGSARGRLQRDLGVTTVFVTHDKAEALAMSDRMAVMEAGRIRQIGTPKEVFQRPASTFVAGFIGSTPMNLLPATVERDTLRVAGTLLAVVSRSTPGATPRSFCGSATSSPSAVTAPASSAPTGPAG